LSFVAAFVAAFVERSAQSTKVATKAAIKVPGSFRRHWRLLCAPPRTLCAFQPSVRTPQQVRLIWAAIRGNIGRHIMKTTIEIADDLFERAQRLAREEKTTFRALTEQGLRLVLKEKQARSKKLPPLVTVPGALTDEFKDAPWEKFRDEIYQGRGA
jgi:hypothetical protein